MHLSVMDIHSLHILLSKVQDDGGSSSFACGLLLKMTVRHQPALQITLTIDNRPIKKGAAPSTFVKTSVVKACAPFLLLPLVVKISHVFRKLNSAI